MRLKEFQKQIQKKKLDAVLLLNTSLNKLDPNMYYFLGSHFETAFLIITKNSTKLIVPKLDEGRAKRSYIKNISTLKSRDLLKMLKKAKLNKKRIGINKNTITLAEYRYLRKLKSKFTDISEDLRKLRVQKDNTEISYIKKACEITDKIMNTLFLEFKKRKFRTEEQVLNFLEHETRNYGLRTSFKPIIASAKNSSFPHHDPVSKLKKGFCIIDFGVRYKGYCSDITRTIYLGNPSKKEKDLYEMLLNIQKNVLKSIKLNMPGKELDNYVKKQLGKYAKNFTHGLGHGIGVEIHENPNIGYKYKDVLKENMLFTIEPGIYFKNKFGIRIEDDVLIAKNKTIILTKTPRHLVCFNMS